MFFSFAKENKIIRIYKVKTPLFEIPRTRSLSFPHQLLEHLHITKEMPPKWSPSVQCKIICHSCTPSLKVILGNIFNNSMKERKFHGTGFSTCGNLLILKKFLLEGEGFQAFPLGMLR